MYKVVTCLAFEHDLRLVILAAVLCFLSSHACFMLLSRARAGQGGARIAWMMTAAASAGFGIWATHFVAMLAYDPGQTLGYELTGTLVSLAVAVCTTAAAIFCAVFVGGTTGVLAAALLFGAGVSSMHFIGMAAMVVHGILIWDQGMMAAAVAFAILFSAFAFFLHAHAARRPARVFGASACMMAGIVLMHFTAMGSFVIQPLANTAMDVEIVPPGLLAGIIFVVAMLLLGCGLVAVSFAAQADKAAAMGEANFRRMVQSIQDYAIHMLDIEGRVSNWNIGAERALGYSEAEIVGRDFALFYSLEDRQAGLADDALRSARRDGRFETEGWRVRKDGTAFWAYVVIMPILDDEKRLMGYTSITRDRTQQMLSSARLKETSSNLNLALDNMANAICLYDQDERLVLHNGRLREIFGFSEELNLVGRTFRELCEMRASHGIEAIPDVDSFYIKHRRLITSPEGGEDIRVIANGKTVRTIHRPTGNGAWVTTIEDITERVRSEERIAHLARHDGLTGLPNRRRFSEMLDTAIQGANRGNRKVAAVCIDLDKFKDVNDTFGHASGDALLSTIAQRMTSGLDASEAVGRLGGDEFVALKTYTDQTQLDAFLARLGAALSEPVDLGYLTIAPEASFGIAIYPQDAQDRDRLLSNADMAMYRSKDSLDQKVSYYEAGMDEAARARRALGRDIAPGIEDGQFYLAYQVQKSARTQTVTGYEVLLRWNHPQQGAIPPYVFIPLAEESGAITMLGEWVLEEACREAAGWPQAHRIAVNLSPLQLSDMLLPEKVRKILVSTGLAPARLELEVTESAIIGDKLRALHILRQIKALGVTIAIDDFGTGYSSLETLRAFPFDKIKLDRSFVAEIGSRQAKAFVRAIVALGKSLDVAVLAEGVETDEQYRFLISEGCDEVQGFLFGRPGTPEQLAIGVTPAEKRAG